MKQTAVWLVQILSLSRLLFAIVFIVVAWLGAPVGLTLIIYAVAATSDLLDGYLSRKFHVQTQFGRVIDLTADKALTLTSALFAAGEGLDLPPLAIIAARETIMLGMRAVVFDGVSALPTNRIFGGVMAGLIWGGTLLLVYSTGTGDRFHPVINYLYWICAALLLFNLVRRVRSRGAILFRMMKPPGSGE